MLAVLVCTVIGAAAPVAIPLLFGHEFRAAVLAAVILVPAAGVLGVNFSLQEGVRGLGRPYLVLRAELFGLLVTAITLALLLRPLGLMGAAIASLLGYSTVTFSMLASVRKIAGTSIASLILPRATEMKRGARRIAAVARELTA